MYSIKYLKSYYGTWENQAAMGE